MRSLILFGVLALCIIVALGDIEQETEVDAVADVLVREAREARRNQKKKSLKRRKGGKGGRKNKGKGPRKNKKSRKSNKKRKLNKARKGQRKTVRTGRADCNMTAVRVVFNIYTKSVALGRQSKQAQKIYKQINNKHSKCDTAFVKPAKVLGEATTNGTTCAGKVADSTIQKDYITLNNCSVSSCELCDISGLGVNDTRLKDCEKELKTVSDTAAACLRSGECTCLTNPPTIPADCDPYATTSLDALKGVKKQCTGADVLGSFTNCTGLAKEVPAIAQECGTIGPNKPPSTATARARDLRGMFNKMML